ncbi:MAG: hypothetical protein IJU81_04375 [Bacteroidales bacterium]|nr:hypothetical protein [Bacteroidales bacterium]
MAPCNFNKVRRSLLTLLVLGGVAVASLATGGCTIYHPQAVDIPLINHSGDTRIDASASMSFWLLPDAVNLNFTGSHGFNDWLAGQFHVNYGGDNMYSQLAPGAYLRLGEHSVLEGYVGLGFGGTWRGTDSQDRHNEGEQGSQYGYELRGHYLLPFAQANIGWHSLTAAHIDIGFGMKVGAYNPDISYIDLDINGDPVAGSEERYTSPNLLLEPQMMLRLGSENVKFNIKIGMAMLSDVNQDSGRFLYDIATGSMGITIAF